MGSFPETNNDPDIVVGVDNDSLVNSRPRRV